MALLPTTPFSMVPAGNFVPLSLPVNQTLLFELNGPYASSMPHERYHALRSLVEEIGGIDNSLIQALDLLFYEANPTVRGALKKESGYFARLFSKENWTDWVENRTNLGKIAAVFSDCVEGSAPLRKFSRRINSLIKKSSEEARIVLSRLRDQKEMGESSSCASTVALGGVFSIVLKNPLPLTISSTCLLLKVSAEKHDPLAALNAKRAQHGIPIPGSGVTYTTSGGASQGLQLPDPLLQTKVDLALQVADILPKTLKRTFEEVRKHNDAWYFAIMRGAGNFMGDFIGLFEPRDKIEEVLTKGHKWYWLTKVYEHYLSVFPDPERGYMDDGSYKIRQMRERLERYHFDDRIWDPIQFIDSLKRSGVCERNWCHHTLKD